MKGDVVKSFPENWSVSVSEELGESSRLDELGSADICAQSERGTAVTILLFRKYSRVCSQA